MKESNMNKNIIITSIITGIVIFILIVLNPFVIINSDEKGLLFPYSIVNYGTI